MSGEAKPYDAVWLKCYYAAKVIVAREAPEKLEHFIASFDPLRTKPDFSARQVSQAIDPGLLANIRAVVGRIPKEQYEFHELKTFGRFVVHNLPEFTAIQAAMTELVGEWAEEKVEPSYNFLSLYTRMGVCDPHLDSPSAKWTLDICIDQSEPWPIHISKPVDWPLNRPNLTDDWRAALCNDPELEFRPVLMAPGDAVLFSGSSQWHYRDPLPRGGGKQFCDLLFFHYIPFGTSDLIVPANWPRLFGVPQIAEIAWLDDA